VVPRKNYFFQFNFTDGTAGSDDYSAEFDRLLQTIVITPEIE
jgi:hypothetical protein